MENQVIKFHHTELITIIDDIGTPYVAIKPICDAIGLNAEAAVRNIKSNPILGPEHTVQSVQVGKNQKRDYLTLPMQYINGWLFSIDVKKVKPNAREKLMIYQKECYKVLFDYYFGNTKNVLNILRRQHQIDVRLKEIKQTVNVLMAEYGTLEREHKQLTANNYAQLGLEFPPAPEKQYALEN